MYELNELPRRRGFFTRTCCVVTAVVLLLFCMSFAEETMPLIRLIDAHTAGVIPKGHLDIENRLYEGRATGFLVSVAVGITDRISMGLGYGAEGIIGRGWDPQGNPFPGCMVKYRILDENFLLPGFAIGFDYQGYGGITRDGSGNNVWGYTGYIYKSEGLFIAASKSYLIMKTIEFGFHGDVNWSLEEIGRVKWPDAWVGFDLGLSRSFSAVIEYDFGLNTRDPHRGDDAYARPWEGYLNAGVRWNFTQNFAVELDVRDVLENRKYLADFSAPNSERILGWSRELKIVYMAPIR
jgi:hypothetical protein